VNGGRTSVLVLQAASQNAIGASAANILIGHSLPLRGRDASG
jgi:hypothetical protein